VHAVPGGQVHQGRMDKHGEQQAGVVAQQVGKHGGQQAGVVAQQVGEWQ
jgi:hypothetical protein